MLSWILPIRLLLLNADSVSTGEELVSKFISSLPFGFADAINCCIKTIRRRVKSKRSCRSLTLKTFFCISWWWAGGDNWNWDHHSTMNYVLCIHRPSTNMVFSARSINHNGWKVSACPLFCYRLLQFLSWMFLSWSTELCYHSVAVLLIWSCHCRGLSHYSNATEKIIVFDDYQHVSSNNSAGWRSYHRLQTLYHKSSTHKKYNNEEQNQLSFLGT